MVLMIAKKGAVGSITSRVFKVLCTGNFTMVCPIGYGTEV
jgi:hypothetical protein